MARIPAAPAGGCRFCGVRGRCETGHWYCHNRLVLCGRVGLGRCPGPYYAFGYQRAIPDSDKRPYNSGDHTRRCGFIINPQHYHLGTYRTWPGGPMKEGVSEAVDE